MTRHNIYRKLSGIDSTLKKNSIIILFFNIMILLLSFLSPIVYKIFIDQVLGEKRWSMLLYVCLSIVLLFAVNKLLFSLLTFCVNRRNNLLSFKLKRKLMKTYLELPFAKVEKIDTGDLKMILEDDTHKLVEFVSLHLIDTVISIGYIVSYFIILLSINWEITLFSLILVIISLLVNKLISQKVKKNNMRNRNTHSDFSNWLFTYLSNWKEIKANALESVQESIFDNFGKKFIFNGNKNIFYWTLSRLIAALKTDLFMYVGILFIGAPYVVNNVITVGTILMYLSYFNIFSNKIDELITLNIDFHGNQHQYNKVVSSLDKLSRNDSKFPVPKKHLGILEVRNLCFWYNKNKKTLNNINFSIKQGEKIAIVGQSGDGKTTLMKCIMGLYHPQQGEVLYNGMNVVEEAVYNDVSCVMQDPVVFNLSIRDNLLLGNSQASDDELVQACQCAEISGFIKTLPEQYNTFIGENGIRLSGGQKQRLVIARALLTNPKFLFLDEATSALNYELEQKINENIFLYFSYTTVIRITHRLLSLADNDRIIVINKGQVVGDDNLRGLLEKNPIFIELYKTQYQKQCLQHNETERFFYG